SLSSIWAGDLNGDGKADVAVTNSGSATNTVSVLLGNGDGTLQTKTDFTTGTNPSSIAAADLNGDSHTDLAVTNQNSNSVSILLGIGNGTFQPKTDFATGSSPASVALGDLNGDHKLDLVVANNGSGANSVSVLLGNGDGSFQAKTDYPTGAGPISVALADLNGDGKLDVVTANNGASGNGSTASVLLGNGDGSLQAGTAYNTAMGPRSVALGDLNGDGVADMIVSCSGSNVVSVFAGVSQGQGMRPNVGNGTFGP